MFEQEVKQYLNSLNEPFTDGTSSHTSLDFHLLRSNVHIDVKEKCQRFSMTNWREAEMPQEYLFILDDLAARKLLSCAPNSFSLVRDSSTRPPGYFVFSIVDLLCIPKKRCRRTIRRLVAASKGKWLIDLRDGAAFATLADSLEYIRGYSKKHKAIFETHIDCWGNYTSEKIGTGGTTRIPSYWKEDAKAHR